MLCEPTALGSHSPVPGVGIGRCRARPFASVAGWTMMAVC
jgi:hypothetical protein